MNVRDLIMELEKYPEGMEVLVEIVKDLCKEDVLEVRRAAIDKGENDTRGPVVVVTSHNQEERYNDE